MTNDSAQSVLSVFLESPRFATGVAAGTLGSSFADLFNLIPWATIPAALGACLSLVLIISQVRGWIAKRRRDRLEDEKLRLEIQMLRDERERRRAAGEPLRRETD